VAWAHQFGRFTANTLGHPQPWWFYLPVLAGLLLPWTPLAGLLAHRSGWSDRRRVFLLAWAAFGFLFFSFSVNKLPGYLLPICPPLAALMGIEIAETRRGGLWLAACALLLALFPVAVPLIPAALGEGLRRAPRPEFHWIWLLPALVAVPVFLLDVRGRRLAAAALVALGATAGVAYVKIAALPQADGLASARPVWRAIESRAGEVCADPLKPEFRYGLGYYAGMPVPACSAGDRPIHVAEPPGQPPRVEFRGP